MNTPGKRRRKPLLIALTVIMTAVLVFFAVIGARGIYLANSASQQAVRGLEKLQTAQLDLREFRFDRAANLAEQAIAHFDLARTDLEKASLVGFLPGFSGPMNQTAELLDLQREVAMSTSGIAVAAEESVRAAFAGELPDFQTASPEDRQLMIQALISARSKVSGMLDRLETALSQLQSARTTGLFASLGGGISSLIGPSALLPDSLAELVPLIEAFPELAGLDRPKTYLVLFQNNQELRPTGGFIGSYGLITLDNGEISDLEIDDSYNLDRFATHVDEEPPYALEKYFAMEKWFFRDSNWAPDFPDSAQWAKRFYDLEAGTDAVRVHGVIAIDTTFVSDMIGVIGPIQASGVTFDQENFVDLLQYQVEQEYAELGIPEEERKAIIGQLASIVIDRMRNLGPGEWLDLAEVTAENLEEKHALLYFTNADLQQMALDNGWAGEVRDSDGDYAFVVDSNLGSRKTDRVVARSIDHSVRLHDGRAIGTIEVTYQNQGTPDYRTSRLRNYMRVYVPQGSELISSQGAMLRDQSDEPGQVDTGEEYGKTYFGALIVIETGETRNILFEYELPQRIYDQIQAGKYELLWQKQPGTEANELTVSLDFDKNSKSFDTDLRVDRVFRIDLE